MTSNSSSFDPSWLAWAKKLSAIAQSGLAYNPGIHDRERYEEIRALAAEMLAMGSGTPAERIEALWSGESGYATPKVDTRGVVFRDGRILLVKELADGGWTLPGGWADVNESPSEAVTKEIREESGLVCRATKILAIYDRSKHPHVPPFPYHIYKLYIRCEIVSGEAATGPETGGVGFFGEEEIPPLSISRVTPAQIARMFAHLRNPALPTDFD